MAGRAQRALAVFVIGATLATMSGSVVVARGRERCEVQPFTLSDRGTFAEPLPDDRYTLRFDASASAVVDCETQLLGVDVWEHAYYLQLRKSASEEWSVSGRAWILLTDKHTGDARRFKGRIEGSGDCDVTVCTLTYDLRKARGGSWVFHHSQVVDLEQPATTQLSIYGGILWSFDEA